ncbi:LPS export ABC transporter periplasmic protein LptC [Acidithiobacillus thiooxidans]|uniref:LPS export ABC transporter periplasmic protein LptC n=1 Tax=Acidithiobacillus thiooxidans TaxID=930 RepID=UPI0002624E1F|nr:LPS export ABC transporter periplasmic protein LptC [Acidithiobacillus thiooxidans]MBU2810239.1 LPS export ABC transporter periplasmic protein LptC [Acidithiobacillus thiooxidans]
MLRLRLPSLGFTVLLMCLAGLVWWSWPQRPLSLPQIDWHGQIHKGDQAAEDVVMRQYDAAGKLDLLATAHTAYHEPRRDQTILKDVAVKRFRPGQELNVSANQGKVDGSSHLITLWGNVIGTMKPDTRFLTERVHYNPQTGIISTQDPVRLEHGQDWMTGMGLWASVKTEEVNILRNVRGVYAP